MKLLIDNQDELNRIVVDSDLKLITELSIPDLGLTTIPDWIFELPQLRSLRANNNAIVTISDSIARLGDTLTELVLNNNKITTLPLGVTQLRNLTTLQISDNELQPDGLPAALGDCAYLRYLKCNKNVLLASIPASLSNARYLQELEASGCALTTLPYEMKANTNLQSVKLAKNNIMTLPPCIPHMVNLFNLTLTDNPIPNGEKAAIKAALKFIPNLFL